MMQQGCGIGVAEMIGILRLQMPLHLSGCSRRYLSHCIMLSMADGGGPNDAVGVMAW